MSYNPNSGYGQALLAQARSMCKTFGRIFILMNSSDTDEENYQRVQSVFPVDPNGQVRFFTSLSSLYSAMESNNNDYALIDNNSSHELDSALTVSKNRCNFLGMGERRKTAQGSKIKLSSTGNAADTEATIDNTGSRNSFINLKIMNSGTHANSVAGMIDEGEGTVIEHCSIMKFTDLDQAAVADFICRADSYMYRDSEFGFDTLVQSAARPTFWYKKDGSTRAKHGRVENCNFNCSSSAATKHFIKVEDTGSLAFDNYFKWCDFTNALVSSVSAAALNGAVTSVSSLAEGNITLIGCTTNADDVCDATGAGDNTNLKTTAPASSAADGGLGIAPVST